MKIYKYIVDERCEFENAICFESDWNERDVRVLAKEAAADYYSVTWGRWMEGDWISIQVFKEDGTSLGVFIADYDMEPKFCVREEESAPPSCPC